MLYTDTPSNFVLVKYYSWRFRCYYSLGWYRGVYSNARLVQSYLRTRGTNYLFFLPRGKVDFFLLLDSADYGFARASVELNISSEFTFSINNS